MVCNTTQYMLSSKTLSGYIYLRYSSCSGITRQVFPIQVSELSFSLEYSKCFSTLRSTALHVAIPVQGNFFHTHFEHSYDLENLERTLSANFNHFHTACFEMQNEIAPYWTTVVRQFNQELSSLSTRCWFLLYWGPCLITACQWASRCHLQPGPWLLPAICRSQ